MSGCLVVQAQSKKSPKGEKRYPTSYIREKLES